jgi:hypothetical protein
VHDTCADPQQPKASCIGLLRCECKRGAAASIHSLRQQRSLPRNLRHRAGGSTRIPQEGTRMQSNQPPTTHHHQPLCLYLASQLRCESCALCENVRAPNPIGLPIGPPHAPTHYPLSDNWSRDARCQVPLRHVAGGTSRNTQHRPAWRGLLCI